MKDSVLIGGACVFAIVLGFVLYFLVPRYDLPSVERPGAERVTYAVIAEGADARTLERKNFALRSEAAFQGVWAETYGEIAPPLPAVDFDRYYVIGVFAGAKPTGGYAIRVAGITDTGSERNVIVSLREPESACIVTQALTSPFQFVRVPASMLPLSKEERIEKVVCD